MIGKIFCGILLVAASPALGAPMIAVDSPTYQFGTINQGQKVDHTFLVRNRGDEPLTIKQVRISCGCTAASLTTKTLAPGKQSEVKVSFDSANFSGQVAKTVFLDSNDPHNPSFTLTLQGTITELVTVVPRTLNLASLKAGSRREVKLVLENRSAKPLTIVSAESPISGIVGHVRDGKVGAGKSGEITVTVTAPKEGRFFSGYLKIKTDSPQKKEIDVPVYATITQ